MHVPSSLKLTEFGGDQLSVLRRSSQVAYLRCYLADLSAVMVLEEDNYFDRDYLSEFSAFYSVSSKGYTNICKRLHFFSENITRDMLRRAAGGSKIIQNRLQSSYLGFTVIRPIEAAPLGRTVLKWYPERTPNTPRVTKPSRDYICHVAGIPLTVNGLAWQQQDTGVSACATIGVWSMLHSSAFDDHHTIPTTAEITKAAHKTASLGARIFPSAGLSIQQITESIKEYSLAPVVLDGEIKGEFPLGSGFGKERFASSCAALIRSGYPVLIIGNLVGQGQHAICATGFRSCSGATDSSVTIQDSNIEYIYVHDDNLGPNARLKIVTGQKGEPIRIKTDSPEPLNHHPCSNPTYPDFIPHQLIVAVHEDLRTSPDVLHKAGMLKADELQRILCAYTDLTQGPEEQANIGVTFSTRFIKLADYMEEELSRLLSGIPKILSKTRLGLSEKVPPMSLHIGVVRIALNNSTPLVDVLFDTTDSDRNHPVFAYIVFNPVVSALITHISTSSRSSYGVKIEAF